MVGCCAEQLEAGARSVQVYSQMTTLIIAVVLVASLVVATGVLFNVKPVNSASSSRELYGWSSYPAGGRENVNTLQYEALFMKVKSNCLF